MKKPILNDVFTQKINLRSLINIKDSMLHLDPNLLKKLGTPINKDYGNLYDILESVLNSGDDGSDHLFYEELTRKFGDNDLSSNILVPFLNVYNKTPTIQDLVIINDPEDSKRLATKHVKKMPNFLPIIHDSIISTTDNKHWKNQRSDFVSAFDPFTSLDKILNISYNRAKECTKILWKLSRSGTEKVNMSEFFLNETQAQLQLALFGLSNEFQEDTNQKIRDAFGGIGETGYVRDFSLSLIKEIKKSKGPLSKVLNDRTAETNTEKYGNAIIFSFAGHDTTGHTLTWLTYELAKNFNYQKRLQKEVDEFWRLNGTNITLSSFKKLPFMTRCIMETLRLWPAVANGTFRELQSNEHINGLNNKKVLLKKGTYVQIFNWCKHRNKKLWGEDAELFNPDREFKDNEIWDNDVYMFYNPASERFSPFTYPSRDCIGKNFAQMEMRLILLHLLRDYNFILTEKQSKESFSNNYKGVNRATLYPKDVYNPINKHNKGTRPYNIGMYVNLIKRGSSL
jgi:cytochrome P450